MAELFRSLIFLLFVIAPGEVGCNKPMTLCWVSFTDPVYVEYVKPSDVGRVRALVEIKQIEKFR